MILRPQESFPKEHWVEYANELEKQNEKLKAALVKRIVDKKMSMLCNCKSCFPYTKEASERREGYRKREENFAISQLAQEMPDIFGEATK